MDDDQVYRLALEQLPREALIHEHEKMANSISHLHRSNEELSEYSEQHPSDAQWTDQVIQENKQTIERQKRRHQFVLGLLQKHGFVIQDDPPGPGINL